MRDERFSIRLADKQDRDTWDAFVKASNDGTIFHTLAFLAYHGNRFKSGEHHLVIEKAGRIHAVMPCAITEENGKKVARSPYGASYGGPVFTKPQNYEDAHNTVSAMLTYLVSLGVSEAIFTLPPRICSLTHSDTFRLVLIEHGFDCTNRDIESTVCLHTHYSEYAEWMQRRSRIERKTRKAISSGIEIVGDAGIEDFWKILEVSFSKLGIVPTHTKEEFGFLCETLPDAVYTDIAVIGARPVAGIAHFVLNSRAICTFYLCQDPEYQHLQAMSALILHALDRASHRGFYWYTFGTSSLKMQANPNLFKFKESFGSVGSFRETYRWKST